MTTTNRHNTSVGAALTARPSEKDLAILSPDFFQKYAVRGPRYTSYPTVPNWTKNVNGEAWTQHLRANEVADASAVETQDLALYVHIPFCRHRCAFCGCNVIITRKEGMADRYLDSVEKEFDLVAPTTSAGRRVVQLHLGGGTPNFLNADEMARLMTMIRSRYEVAENAEISIEVDPRTSSRDEVRRLYEIDGFTRISFGVQDFNPDTQEAIGRGQTYDITLALVDEARQVGFSSVNVDLIYGLPEQTQESWRRTIDRFLDLRPARLALYNFAYLPAKLSNQRSMDPDRMPDVGEKLAMFLETNERLFDAGYRFIGMDHYSLEEDDLTRALDDETLHRNFMGYTTLRGTDMLSFGVSSISDAWGGFAQNTKKLSVYERELAEGRLPVEEGLFLTEDDLQRRWVIESIMCSGVVRKTEFNERFGADFDALYADEIVALAPLSDDELIVIEADVLRVTFRGRFVLRNIAMVFDAYLPGRHAAAADKPQPTFSKTL